MINTKKYININYVELKKTKEWMNKNLSATGKSPFIRAAVLEKIGKLELDKKDIPKSNKK
jgi:hypothetical protein